MYKYRHTSLLAMYFVDVSVYVQKELQGTFSPLANKRYRVNHV